MMIFAIPFQIYIMMAIPEMIQGMMDAPQEFSNPMEVLRLIPQGFFIAYGVYMLGYLINIGYNIYLYFQDTRTMGYRILGMEIIEEKTGKKPSVSRL